MGSLETLSHIDRIFTVLVLKVSVLVLLSRDQGSSRHLTSEETNHLIDQLVDMRQFCHSLAFIYFRDIHFLPPTVFPISWSTASLFEGMMYVCDLCTDRTHLTKWHYYMVVAGRMSDEPATIVLLINFILKNILSASWNSQKWCYFVSMCILPVQRGCRFTPFPRKERPQAMELWKSVHHTAQWRHEFHVWL